MGYPSIAVSLASMTSDTEYFKYAAEFTRKFIPRIKEIEFPKKTVLNINIPALPEEDISGIAITRLGNKMFTDEYDKRVDPRGKVYYWMAGDLIKHNENDDTDINAVRWNKVSITPITFEMTLTSIIPELEEAFCKDTSLDWLKSN